MNVARLDPLRAIRNSVARVLIATRSTSAEDIVIAESLVIEEALRTLELIDDARRDESLVFKYLDWIQGR